MDVPPAKLMDFPIAHFLPGFALALLTPNFFGEQPEVRNPEIRKKKNACDARSCAASCACSKAFPSRTERCNLQLPMDVLGDQKMGYRLR